MSYGIDDLSAALAELRIWQTEKSTIRTRIAAIDGLLAAPPTIAGSAVSWEASEDLHAERTELSRRAGVVDSEIERAKQVVRKREVDARIRIRAELSSQVHTATAPELETAVTALEAFETALAGIRTSAKATLESELDGYQLPAGIMPETPVELVRALKELRTLQGRYNS